MDFENLPKPIQDWLDSDRLTDILVNLSNRYGLSHRPAFLPRLIFRFVSQDIDGARFYGMLALEMGGDKIITEQLIREIKDVVFAPIRESLQSIYIDTDSIKGIGDPAQQQATPASTNQSALTVEQLKPQTPPQGQNLKPNLVESNEIPFILHHEEEMKPQVEAARVETSPLRPMFYKAPTAPPPVEEKFLGSRPIAARLELGVETQPVAESAPKMSRTPIEEVRQVNYSEFRTSLNNPFAGTLRPKKSEQNPEPKTATGTESKNESLKKPAVPDTNVVDLKDLPL